MVEKAQRQRQASQAAAHGTCSQEAEGDESWCSTRFFLFMQPGTQV